MRAGPDNDLWYGGEYIGNQKRITRPRAGKDTMNSAELTKHVNVARVCLEHGKHSSIVYNPDLREKQTREGKLNER